MGVRQATLEDAPELIRMGLNFAATSVYANMIDPYKIGQIAGTFIMDKDKLALICEGGMLLALAMPFVYGTKLTATEMAWWVEPEYRNKGIGIELINAFQDWAKLMGCAAITLTCLDDDVGSLYNKLGYKLSERSYVKEI